MTQSARTRDAAASFPIARLGPGGIVASSRQRSLLGTGTGTGTGLTVLDQIVSSLSNFALLAAGLWLPLGAYGALAIAVVAYVVTIGLTRAFLLEPLTAGGQLATSARRAMLHAVAFAATASVFLLSVGLVSGGAVEAPFLLLAVGLPLLAFQDVGRYVAFHRRAAQRALLSDIIWLALFALSLGVSYVISNRVSVSVLFACWLASGGVASFVFAPYLLRREQRMGRLLTTFNIGFGLDYALGALLLQVVQLSLAAVVPVAAYGRLRAATTITSPLTVLFTAMTTTLLATASARVTDSPRALFGWISRLRLLLFGFVCAYSAFVIALVALETKHVPPTVRHSLELLAPITLGNAVLAFDSPLVLKMKALCRQNLLARVRSIQAIASLAAPLAALKWGIVGGAWALASSQGLGFTLRTLMSRRADRRMCFEGEAATTAG